MRKTLFYAVMIAVMIAVETVMAKNCATVMEPIGNLGDLEIIVDPEGDGDLLMAANLGSSPYGAPIAIYHMDGETGQVVGGPAIVADNYTGIVSFNGPEFVYHPDHGVGVLYAGPDGVHGVFRVDGQWGYDAYGRPAFMEPPALPGTSTNLYPGVQKLGVKTHHAFYGDCCRRLFNRPFPEFRTNCETGCIGTFTDTTTDMAPALKDLGYEIVTKTMVHPGDDGYGIFGACGNDGCAIFEVAIDEFGGLLEQTWLRLTPFRPGLIRASSPTPAIHPSTGRFVLYLVTGGNRIEVWEAASSHRPLTRTARSEPLPFRPKQLQIVSSDSALYLHFLDREGAERGAYVSVYDTTPQAPLYISNITKGTELAWMPKANALALFFKRENDDRLKRCWIDWQL